MSAQLLVIVLWSLNTRAFILALEAWMLVSVSLGSSCQPTTKRGAMHMNVDRLP